MAELRCTNAEAGHFNHECGKPAIWAGTHKNGHIQYFCDRCRISGNEASTVASWRPLNEIAGRPSSDSTAVDYMLRRIREDGRLAYLLVYTQAWALLLQAAAARAGMDVSAYQELLTKELQTTRVVAAPEVDEVDDG